MSGKSAVTHSLASYADGRRKMGYSHGFGPDSLFHLGDGLPVMLFGASMVLYRRGEGTVSELSFRTVLDGRVLDPKGKRANPLVHAKFTCAVGDDGRLTGGRLFDEVKTSGSSAFSPATGTVPRAQMKAGGFVHTAADTVLKAMAEGDILLVRALSEGLTACSADIDGRIIPEAEEVISRLRQRIAQDGGSDYDHRNLDSRITGLDSQRQTLARQLDVQAVLGRLIERAEGVSTDTAQRAAQQAARVISERLDAAERNRTLAAEADVRAAQRARDYAAALARKERFLGVSDELLALVREVASAGASAAGVPEVPSGGWASWLERAAALSATVDPVQT